MYKSIKNIRFLNIALAIVLLISFGCKPDVEIKSVKEVALHINQEGKRKATVFFDKRIKNRLT